MGDFLLILVIWGLIFLVIFIYFFHKKYFGVRFDEDKRPLRKIHKMILSIISLIITTAVSVIFFIFYLHNYDNLMKAEEPLPGWIIIGADPRVTPVIPIVLFSLPLISLYHISRYMSYVIKTKLYSTAINLLLPFLMISFLYFTFIFLLGFEVFKQWSIITKVIPPLLCYIIASIVSFKGWKYARTKLTIDKIKREKIYLKQPKESVRLDNKENVKSLIKTLEYLEDGNVRKVAAEQLGRIKDVRAVKPLINALGDKNKNVRKAAAKALGEIKDIRSIEPLIYALKDGDEDVRSNAINSLEKIGKPALEPLIKVLSEKNKNVRKAAAYALSRIGDTKAVEALVQAQKDVDIKVRETAKEALAKIKNQQA